MPGYYLKEKLKKPTAGVIGLARRAFRLGKEMLQWGHRSRESIFPSFGVGGIIISINSIIYSY
jgi:hypothetical protein